jgi:1-acyl-sn-glycerol-3-phosphate acyltransferase
MLILRSLLFYIGLILSLFIFAPLSLLIFPLPYRQRYLMMTGWGRFVIWWLEKTCQITYEVKGLENIPSEAAIVLSKHQSAWETMIFQQIFPPQIWLLKRELLWLPLFGWALATLQPIAIDRKNLRDSLQQIVKQGKKRLAQGLWIIIFPEGTRVKVGEKKRYGIGGARLAEQSGYPVVPVAHNSGEFWISKSIIKKPGKIKMVIGPTLDTKGKTYQEINTLVENWIEDTMLKL